ncbi:GNAT family N-acetyltransferase [Aspergillus clavatus NRRL 1]|uniref:GNAT family acetyltransferase, putative n=1 Tax=Aspergillus clavatus (strain ATCC 1007 / CBS 513.65 / DSM 816 / NCTC 3887 / NRRL 1 / QM 1276 / 107) TaxID=344612 RepID=A1CMU9_ASPCL|nr:GNAT family acetyltransferase, putative [Aspergillus clavatus NRRL 1]EAW08886.1 GNAT family acetyltransferase, putative [Aspergillus clavatus NRRL 1]
MAYQFFAKAHQSNKAPTSPPLSPPPSSPSSRYNKPSMQPPSVALSHSPGSIPKPNIASRLKPPAGRDTSCQLPAYPHPISPGYQTPHPHITIDPVSTAHIPSLTRITGLLLPIRYPNSFYTATITDPVIASVSRVAIYHDHPVVAAPSSTSSSPASSLGASTGTDKVIGGIRCRLERSPDADTAPQSATEPTNLYIQTLHLLSPYRGSGVAASLLNALLFATTPSPSSPLASAEVSALVRHYNIRTVTAHVHEANDEGLKWYLARGFQVEEGLVENYYRRLKPSGAKIVKLVLDWSDDDGEEDIQECARYGENDADAKNEDDDEDWEKVEAEDSDDPDTHGVQPVTDSKVLEFDEGPTRKRKADDEPQRL